MISAEKFSLPHILSLFCFSMILESCYFDALIGFMLCDCIFNLSYSHFIISVENLVVHQATRS